MQNLKDLDTSTLLDMLVRYTGQYLKLVQEGNKGKEYIDCKLVVNLLHTEIASRSETASNNPVSVNTVSGTF